MLNIVAIIGVLVAISIPIFTSQLEKAREATDLANIRSAYAECSAAVLTGSGDDGVTMGANNESASKTVTLTQKTEGWSTDASTKVAGKALTDIPSTGTVTVTVNSDGTWTCGNGNS